MDYTYKDLVDCREKLLFTIKIESPPDFFENKDGEWKLKYIYSGLWLYGGRAPSDLNTLLTWEHLHKVRKEWCVRLIKYYQIFLPGLTLKSMWEIILKQRNDIKGSWVRRPHPYRSFRHRKRRWIA
jgi:hypothetical protein